MSNSRPSLFRIFTTDYMIFTCMLFPIISLIVIIASFVMAAGGDMIFLVIMVVISIITLAIAGIRFISILTIWNEDQTAEATISHISFFRDRGNIHYEFMYLGTKYGTKQHVMKTTNTAKYNIGDRVNVLIDRNQPQKAFIKELFQ